jgi:guanine deaminase
MKFNLTKIIKLAIDEAKAGVKKGGGGPFGAVIFKNGKIISSGHNEVIKTNDPTNHAEIVAIRKAVKKLKRFNISDCEIYSSCEPCPMCYSALYWAGIKKLYFGCTKKDAEKIGFMDNHLYEVFGGKTKSKIKTAKAGREESLKVFKLWEGKSDKVLY